MRRLCVALCVTAIGCADLLSLDDVADAGEDVDRDGVRDVVDNCKGVENPDQADSDTRRVVAKVSVIGGGALGGFALRRLT